MFIKGSKVKLYTLGNVFIKETNNIPVDFTGIAESFDGRKIWYADRLWHRLDGPAIENSNETKQWWINGKLHRINGPAIEGAGGSKFWHIHGKSVTELQHKLLCDLMKLKGLL